MKCQGFALGCVALASALAVSAVRADSEHERRTLAGLQGVHVDVYQPDAEAGDVGLARETLLGDVEDALRTAGVGLLTEEEVRRTPGVPWLQVQIATFKTDKKNQYAWRLQLFMLQRACLERDAKICEWMRTWEATRSGTVGAYKQKSIREDLRAMAAEFATAYRTANGQ